MLPFKERQKQFEMKLRLQKYREKEAEQVRRNFEALNQLLDRILVIVLVFFFLLNFALVVVPIVLEDFYQLWQKCQDFTTQWNHLMELKNR